MLEQRNYKAQSASWQGIFGNFVAALFKGTAGWWTGSQALLADAAYSFAAVARSITISNQLRTVKHASEEGQLHFYRKAKLLALVIIPFFLMSIGLESALASFKSLLNGGHEPQTWYALAAIVVTIFVKAVIAGVWKIHTGFYSSVVTLIGVGGALLGKMLNVPALYALDSLAGLFVSVLILKMGYRFISESLVHTKEQGLHEEEALELVRAVQCVKGVVTVDELHAREHGHYVVVDVKISVNPKISVMEGHDIAKMVKLHLMRRFHQVSDVFIQVNPYDSGYMFKRYSDSDQTDYPSLLH